MNLKFRKALRSPSFVGDPNAIMAAYFAKRSDEPKNISKVGL